MTSGTFTSFPVDRIFVDRTTRQRKEIGDVSDLAVSIRDRGLIHPIVIKRSGELVAGERRYTAVRSLGWTSIPAQYVDDLDPKSLVLIELEENIKRKDISWQESAEALKKFHELKKSEDPDWTQDKTAEAIGLGVRQVKKNIAVAKEIERGNERVKNAPKFSTAANIVARERSRAESSLVDKFADRKSSEYILADFVEWQRNYAGPRFNLIHCDFPYGVNADKHDQGAAASMGGYSDTFEIYEKLLSSLSAGMDNVVAESAHLIFWFSMDYYQFTKDRLEQMGWIVNPFPLVWTKGNTGILPDPNRGPRRTYETAFFASNGDRKIVKAVSNSCVCPPGDKEIHMSEKPVEMLKHFMGMVVDEYSTVLDPTAGSGNALKAAKALGASSVLGLEINKEFYERAVGGFNG